MKEAAATKQPQAQQPNATSPSAVSEAQSGALIDGGQGFDGEQKRRKARTTFTGSQIFVLRNSSNSISTGHSPCEPIHVSCRLETIDL